jgi:putative glutamine amidotransferase
MTARPIVGITAYPRTVEIVPTAATLHTANRFFVDAVARAGGIPLILPVLDPALAPGALAAVAALVLPGGGDVDPAAYGEDASPTVAGVDAARDAWELACALAALDRRMPMLAICRGAQVLNVALGGTLVQDIGEATGERHGWAERYLEPVHAVTLSPTCRLAIVLGTTEVGANSLHHQAVGVPGRGVTAVGWAPDGTVEAIAVADHPEVVAVQWHPELMEEDALQQRLFSDLVARAATEAGRRAG